MNLLLLTPDELEGDRVAIQGRRAAHVREVLRATPGATLRVGLLDGPLGTAEVTAVGEEVVLRCAFGDDVPPRPPIDLLLAVPRPKVLRRLWAPLASLGVGRIMLSNAWKVERPYFASHWLQPEVYTPLLMEGLEQAGDTRLPEVTVHKRLRKLVEDELDELSPGSFRLAAHPHADVRVGEALLSRPSRVLLAVGPEGGWIERELELLGRAHFQIARFSTRVLRTDTACLVLLGLVQAMLEDRS